MFIKIWMCIIFFYMPLDFKRPNVSGIYLLCYSLLAYDGICHFLVHEFLQMMLQPREHPHEEGPIILSSEQTHEMRRCKILHHTLVVVLVHDFSYHQWLGLDAEH